MRGGQFIRLYSYSPEGLLNGTYNFRSRFCVLCVLFLPLEMSTGEEPTRVTPAVKVIDKIQNAIVPVFCSTPEGQLVAGSATVIHPDGFMLTADHVTQEMPRCGSAGARSL